MKMRFSRGFITGSILGTLAGMIVVPQLNYKARKQLSAVSRMVMDKTNQTNEDNRK